MRPFQRFADRASSGGIVLIAAAVVALAWANSPWGESYAALWNTKLTIGVGDLSLSKDLTHWVNDGLMALFFLVVGLELKREVFVGELSSLRGAARGRRRGQGGGARPDLPRHQRHIRRFIDDPGEVLERVREQIGSTDDGGKLEARHRDLSRRLASRQAEKDRYVRTYAQGYISEEELEVYLADLKNQTDNLRLLLTSIEAERSQKREEAELADTTEAWLLALRERVEEVEGDTEEAFQSRRRLVKLLVQAISTGKRPDDGRTEIKVTYRFGPPPAEVSEGSSVVHFKNGSRS